ncbi:MAG: HAD family hydrolase [Candidatus Rokubacteria bacterium]|nr:HAD family hydrolase [Candidatus Rokubacteria bacterium]
MSGTSPGAPPDVLALDFDGVLCDGMREYFETSRRTHARIWPAGPVVGDDAFPAFRRLRPVITTGWEMPLLLRAIALGQPEAALATGWEAARDRLVAAGDGLRGPALIDRLTHDLDDVRRQWLAADPGGWLAENIPYCRPEELRRLVAETGRAVLVTTKEGEFARRILDDWGVTLAGIEGKEAGTHKCENLRALIADHVTAHGRRPRLWFVEDRLETLQHVTTHPDLGDVGLFLAAWGYNTEATRASVAGDPRVRLLDLARFRQGLTAWL